MCSNTRRCAAITHTAAHMVNQMHFDGRVGAILDNNDPGEWEWCSGRTHVRTWVSAPHGRYGWAVAFLAPPPPPGLDALRPTPPSRPVSPDRPCPGPGPCPWRRVVYSGGVVEWKLYSPSGEFLGQLQADGWHPAVAPDAWTGSPEGAPPVERPEVWDARYHEAPKSPGPGVEWSKIDTTRDRYWVNGIEVDRSTAFVALAVSAGGDFSPLEDDSDKYHLTLLAPDRAERDRLLLLARAAAGIDRVHLQVYTPEDWAANRVSSPLTLQAPAKTGGRVVFTGSASASTIAEALARSDPDWKPPPPTPEPAPPPRPRIPEPKRPEPSPPCCPNCPECPACRPSRPSPRQPEPPQANQPPESEAAPVGHGVVALAVMILSAIFRRDN